MKTLYIVAAYLGIAAITLPALGQDKPSSVAPVEGRELDQDALAGGFRALESGCFSCHSPDAGMENRIAPPMAAIKKHYVDKTTSFDDFRGRLVAFVNDPSESNARMPGAIAKYGAMPKLSFDTEVVEQIAYYIYHSELEAPDWFEQHYRQEQQKSRRAGSQRLTSDADYLRRGQEIAMRAKSLLGSNLKQAMMDGGPVAAIAFCNENAVPITSSVSSELNASVSRVSDRPRNSGNAANALELNYIAAAKSALAAGNKPGPSVQEIDGKMVAYYPIVTNGMCLQCHGSAGRELNDETINAIDARYPHDQATGYGLNELRGIFVVSMDKE